MAGRLDQDRDRLICQGLIIRGLKNESTEAHGTLFNELLRQKEMINENKDIQLQTLIVRSLRKLQQPQGRLDSLQEAMTLMDMVRGSYNM